MQDLLWGVYCRLNWQHLPQALLKVSFIWVSVKCMILFTYIQLIQSKLNSKLVLKGILENTFYLHAEMTIRRKTGLKNRLPKHLRNTVKLASSRTHLGFRQGHSSGLKHWVPAREEQGLWHSRAEMTSGNGHLHTREVLLQRGPGRTPLLAFKIPFCLSPDRATRQRIWKATEVLKKEVNQWVKSHLLSFMKLCSS